MTAIYLTALKIKGGGMKNNCYLYTHDPILIMLYDEAEAIEVFGQDGLDDCGSVLPENLIRRFKDCMIEVKTIQNELRKYRGAK